jgi:hypothetical protein
MGRSRYAISYSVISDMSTNITASSSLSNSSLYFNLQLDDASTTTTTFTYFFQWTQSSFNSIVASYFAFSDGTYVELQYLDLSSSLGSLATINSIAPQSITIPTTYNTKSNASRAVVKVLTVSATYTWINGAFGYTITKGNYLANTFDLGIAVAVNSSISSIRVCIIDYESVLFVVNPPYYLSDLTSSSISGTVPEVSGLAITDTSEIFNGIMYMTFNDAQPLNFSLGFIQSSFTVGTTASAFSFEFLWYKMETCGNNYYIDTTNLSNCLGCDVTCLTCSGSLSTNCISCTSTRTLTGNSCPCNTGYYEALVSDCLVCNLICYTCNGTADNCTACRNGDNRATNYSSSTGKTSCLCITGFYDSGV